MTAFPEWLGQVGLAHCRPILQAHGIDFDSAAHLSEDDLRRLGLDQGDSQKLLQAIASRGQTTVGGERRQQLTVMFCDLVDYTGLSDRLDPEDLRDLRQAFVEACFEGVRRYDGHVAEIPGDALVVYFGWPGAHEDDPECCVRSALAIVEAVKRLKAIEPLAAHIGIATGEVVVGGRGSGFGGSELAVGKAPNLAARLQKIARAHEIIISHATRSLVGDTFELTDLGMMPLTGIGPSQVWRVEAVRRAAGRFDAAHGGTPLSALVGRTEELARLLRDWHLARDGAGRVILVGGEAGIGKSRLTQVLRETIAGEPHTTLRYQCSRMQELSPCTRSSRSSSSRLGLLVRTPRINSSTSWKKSCSAVLRSAPTGRRCSLRCCRCRRNVTRRSGSRRSSRRKRRFEALLGQVEALSQIKPLLMIVEDVHWIDPTSQELLDALVSRLPALPILLVITYRPQPPQEYTPSWIESAHVTRMTLTGLAA